MVDFYQRLLKGEGRAEALRNAQLVMKRNVHIRFIGARLFVRAIRRRWGSELE